MYENTDEIDLSKLWKLIVKKLHIIAACMALGVCVSFIITKFFITPQYMATTRLYVLAKNPGNENITTSELQASTLLSNDYVELIGSKTVRKEVTDKVDSGLTPDQLTGKMTVSVQNTSRVLSISVTDPDPEMACTLANLVREAAAVQIKRVMNSEAVNVVDVADVPTSPYSPNMRRNLLIGAAAGLALALAYCLFVYFLDDSIVTEEEAEKTLNLSILGSVPKDAGGRSK